MPVFGLFSSDDELSLTAATKAVTGQNTGLTARELRIRASWALAESTRALEDPRVSYSLAPSSIGTDIPSNFGNALRGRQMFQVSQVFPWSGKQQHRTGVAEARTKIDYDQLLVSLVQQVRGLWSQRWYADQALLNDLESVAATRYANRLGLQQDVLQIQTSLIELDHRGFVLNQEIRRLQARINDLLNQPADFPLGLPGEQLANRVLPGRSELVEWVLEARSRMAHK